MTNTTAPYEDQRKHYIDRDHPIHGRGPLLPDKDGEYTVYIPFIGPMKAWFCGGVFHFENGEKIADSLCRWWK